MALAALAPCAVLRALVAGPGGPPCPAAADLPLLTIDDVRDSPLPITDRWQVVWGNTALSDAQLASLSGEAAFIERTQAELRDRSGWVFAGVGVAAVGAAASSAGWILYGQNELSQGLTLSLAVGGLIVGVVGVLFATERIQTPLEPHLAPTPVHRLSRAEARMLLSRVNRRLIGEICSAAATAAAAQ